MFVEIRAGLPRMVRITPASETHASHSWEVLIILVNVHGRFLDRVHVLA